MRQVDLELLAGAAQSNLPLVKQALSKGAK
jgi:hypothetical protein